MISDIIDLILFPVGKFFDLLTDSRITSYLGASVLGIAVTIMLTFIVFRALVSTVSSNALAFGSHLSRRDRAERTRSDRGTGKGE